MKVMHIKKQIAVIIPAFRAKKTILEVINGIPEYIDYIIVIDDNCPEECGKLVESTFLNITRIKVIYHCDNMGVGGATKTGYKQAIDLGCDIVIKMDSDGQMDSAYIPKLIEPFSDENVGYCKGNRFNDLRALRPMPKIRLIGNSLLSFTLKICSGHWTIMDPTNGYTAISKTALAKLDLDKIDNRYFFESDMLINTGIYKIVVRDIPIPAKYVNEISSLSIRRVVMNFPLKLLKGFLKRLIFCYLIYDFNMGSIYILIGVPMFIWGLIFGIVKWIINSSQNIPTPTGTIMLSVLPLILGTQFILQAIHIDITSNQNK